MANYCFSEGKQALWNEAHVRGWLAALLDFPQDKSHEESTIAVAQGVPDELRSDVCCIGDDELGYRQLVVAAWRIGYAAVVKDLSERKKV